jgi:hypothetical protein
MPGLLEAVTRTEMTEHGVRALARTTLHEELERKPEAIEHQLALRSGTALRNVHGASKLGRHEQYCAFPLERLAAN